MMTHLRVIALILTFAGSTIAGAFDRLTARRDLATPVFSGATGDQLAPDVASNDDYTVFAWLDGRSGGYELDVYANVLDRNGLLRYPSGTYLPFSPGSGRTPPRVFATQSGFIVTKAASNGTLEALRLGSEGELLDSKAIALHGGGATIAVDVTEDRLLTAWVENNRPYVAMFDSELRPLLSRVEIAPFPVRTLLLAGSREEFLILGCEGNACDRVFAIQITDSGRVTNLPHLDADTAGLIKRAPMSMLTGGEDTYLLSTTESRRAFVRALDRSAVAIRPAVLLDTRGAGQKIVDDGVWTDGQFVLVWDEGINVREQRIVTMRIDTRGEVVDSKPVVVTAAPGAHTNPVVSADEQGLLIAWETGTVEDRYGFPYRITSDVVAKRVRSFENAQSGTEGFLVQTPGAQFAPATAASNDRFGIVWAESRESDRAVEIRAVVATAGGDLINPPRTLSSAIPRTGGFTSAIASDGNSFIVVWREGARLISRILSATGEVDVPVADVSTTACGGVGATWTGTEYLIASGKCDGNALGMEVFRLTATNSVRGSAFVSLAQPPSYVSITPLAERVVVTISTYISCQICTCPGLSYYLASLVLDRSGNPVTQLVSFGTAAFPEVRTVREGDVVAVYASEYGLIKRTEMKADGTLGSRTTVAISPSPSWISSPAVATATEGTVLLWTTRKIASAEVSAAIVRRPSNFVLEDQKNLWIGKMEILFPDGLPYPLNSAASGRPGTVLVYQIVERGDSWSGVPRLVYQVLPPAAEPRVPRRR